MTAYQQAVSLSEAVHLIATTGHLVSYVLEGSMGTGKSQVLWTLKEKFPDHICCYFDCTTKIDGGDLALPNLQVFGTGEDGQPYVKYVPTEELGLHTGKPIILMLDEIGKNRALLPALTRILNERNLNGTQFPEGSIVFATTNKSGKKVGDFLDPHQWNRVTRLPIRKPSASEWQVWAINNNVHPVMIKFVDEFPKVMQDYEEVSDPTENRYIFHPKDTTRQQFVTGRSMEKASHILHGRDANPGLLPDEAYKTALAGTIGAPAALDLMAYIQLSDQMPSLKEIKENPEKAMVPDNISAVFMLVYNALGNVDKDWITPWMKYLVRLPKEAQAMFVGMVTDDDFDSKKQQMFFHNSLFRDWLMKNKHLYTKS